MRNSAQHRPSWYCFGLMLGAWGKIRVTCIEQLIDVLAGACSTTNVNDGGINQAITPLDKGSWWRQVNALLIVVGATSYSIRLSLSELLNGSRPWLGCISVAPP